MPHATSNFKVTPIEPPSGSNVKFGAIVEGVDLNNIDENTFLQLKDAIFKNQLVVIKDQQALTPINHFNFVHRFDPEARPIHGHGTVETVKKKHNGNSSLLAGVMYLKLWICFSARLTFAQVTVLSIPGAPGVRLVAAGYQGEDHYGLKDIDFKTSTILNTHANPPSKEDIDKGFTRFGRWHIDCAMYDLEPPRVTALRCLKLPKGPDQTIRWEDDSGTEMKTAPGLTAFYSCEQLYEMLTPDEKAFADNSRVAYSPHPYLWISKCKQDSLGMTIPQGQGREISSDEMPPFEESKLKEYPMVWHNEVTRKPAFMVHAIIAQKLLLKNSPDAEVTVIDNVDEVRAWLYKITRRIIEPENILLAPYGEGDIAVWNNRCMQHTFIEYPESYGPRTMHQVNIPASIPPS